MTLRESLTPITILMLATLLSGCNDKDATGGMNEGFRSAPAGLAFSTPGGELTFFGMGDGQVRETVPLEGWAVTSAAINLQGNRLVVADGAHARIGLLSLPELNEMSSISLSGVPTDLQISASGALAYVITQNSNFWVFSLSSGQADTLEIGARPRRLALRPPTSTQAWIACAGDSTVCVVNIAGLQIVEILEFGLRPTAVAFSSDGTRGYVALAGPSGLVFVLDASTYEVLDSLQAGTGPFDMAVSANSRYLAISDSMGGRARVWDLATREYWNISTGAAAGRIRYSAITNSFFVCSNSVSEVLKIEMGTGVPAHTVTTAVAPYLREVVLWESPL